MTEDKRVFEKLALPSFNLFPPGNMTTQPQKRVSVQNDESVQPEFPKTQISKSMHPEEDAECSHRKPTLYIHI